MSDSNEQHRESDYLLSGCITDNQHGKGNSQ